jgi:hypothetical protein
LVPGTHHLNKEISDDDLGSAWRLVVDEKNKLVEKFKNVSDNLKANEEAHTQTIQSINTLDSRIIDIEVKYIILF